MNNRPLKKDTKNIRKIILRDCLIGLLIRNKTRRPTPALARIALKKAPSGKVFSANSWADRTEVAQLGINPISEAIIGPNKVFFNKPSFMS